MSYLVIEGKIPTAVANNGSFNIAYPAGTAAASFESIGGLHSLACNGSRYASADNKIAVVFGASNITVTNQIGRTLDAGTDFWLQLDTITSVLGTDEVDVFKNGNRIPAKVSEVTQSVTIAGNVVGNLSVSGSSTLNGTITAPNATSVLGNQVANVGTLDNRYWGSIEKKGTGAPQTIDSLGGWVQLVEFSTSGYRTNAEFWCAIGTANNLQSSFQLVFGIDPYTSSAQAANIPNCLSFRIGGAGFPFLKARVRMVGASSPRTTCFDVQFDPSTNGINSEIWSWASLQVQDIFFAGTSINRNVVVNPSTAGNIIGHEFMLSNNAIIKLDAGDYSGFYKDGQQIINAADNNIKIYADGALRQIASW